MAYIDFARWGTAVPPQSRASLCCVYGSAASCYGDVEAGDWGTVLHWWLKGDTAYAPAGSQDGVVYQYYINVLPRVVPGDGTAYVVHMMFAAAAGCHVDHRAIDQFATGTSVRSQQECDQSTASRQHMRVAFSSSSIRCLTHVSLGQVRCSTSPLPHPPTALYTSTHSLTHHPPPTCVPRMCTSTTVNNIPPNIAHSATPAGLERSSDHHHQPPTPRPRDNMRYIRRW